MTVRMKPRIEPPEQLLDLIYDAATDDNLWPAVLAGVADLTGSLNGALYGQSITAGRIDFSHVTRSSEECQRAFRERHVQNPWSLYMNLQPAGAMVASDQIISLSELKKTAFYDEVHRPQDIAQNAMIPLEKRRDFVAAFNICRSERQGPFEAPQMAILARLLPHLRRSLALGHRLNGYKALQRAEFQLLDQLSTGVILLDRSAKVILANQAARLLSSKKGPLILRDAGIAGHSPASSRRLDELVQAALRGMPAATMGIPHPADGRLVTLFVSPVRSHDQDRFGDLGLRDAAVMIFVFDPSGPTAMPAEWIMDVYGLTMAEARVAMHASSGKSVAETAVQLNISPNTVKTHLRHVYAKTGAGGQAELASLMAPIRLMAGAQPH